MARHAGKGKWWSGLLGAFVVFVVCYLLVYAIRAYETGNLDPSFRKWGGRAVSAIIAGGVVAIITGFLIWMDGLSVGAWYRRVAFVLTSPFRATMDAADRVYMFSAVRAFWYFVFFEIIAGLLIAILSLANIEGVDFWKWIGISSVVGAMGAMLTVTARLSHKEVAEYCNSFLMRAQLALPLISPMESGKVELFETKCGIRCRPQGQNESRGQTQISGSGNARGEAPHCIQDRILAVNFAPAHQWYSNHMMVYLSIQANWLNSSACTKRKAIRIFVWDDAYLKREEACKLLSMHKYLGIDACILKPRYYELMLERWRSCPDLCGDKWGDWEDFLIWDPPRDLDDSRGDTCNVNHGSFYGFAKRGTAEQGIDGKLVDVFWNVFSCLWLVSYQLSDEDNPNNMEGVLAFYRQHCEKDGKDILAMERFITRLCCDQLRTEIIKAQEGIRRPEKATPQEVLKRPDGLWKLCEPIPTVPRSRCAEAKRKDVSASAEPGGCTSDISKKSGLAPPPKSTEKE